MIIPRSVKTIAEKVGGKALVKTQKYSPEILTVVGIAGFVVTVVLAAKATLKLEETLDTINERRREVNQDAQLEDPNGRKLFTDGEIKQKMTKVYLKGGLELTKLYGPAVGVGVGSITAILAAHGIMQRRQVALTAAYSILEKSFSQYRARVVSDLGEDKDREYRSGLIVHAEVDKDGNKTITEMTVSRPLNEYEFMFSGDTSYQWSKDLDYNMFFLTSQQTYWNDKLYSRGHVFLNEVLDALGLDHTTAGSVVGWVKDSENGDNFIDFGFDKWENIALGSLVDGTEGHILLEFNVDGTIFDKI